MSKEALIGLIAAEPGLSAAQAAERLGITRQRVYQIAARYGLKLRSAKKGRLPHDVNRPRQQFAPGLSSHFVGGASEMTVCAYLLRAGVPVYRACTFVCAADLIANVAGQLMRIEVRSARVNPVTHHWSYPSPKDKTKYDVLALVDHDGNVRLRPDILRSADER